MLTPVLMKVLFALLLISVGAILVTVAAMWWRLRRHLRRPGAALHDALETVQPERESTE